jgi:hypothetical protein
MGGTEIPPLSRRKLDIFAFKLFQRASGLNVGKRDYKKYTFCVHFYEKKIMKID